MTAASTLSLFIQHNMPPDVKLETLNIFIVMCQGVKSWEKVSDLQAANISLETRRLSQPCPCWTAPLRGYWGRRIADNIPVMERMNKGFGSSWVKKKRGQTI